MWVTKIVERFWRLLSGKWRWYLLWLTNPKFVFGVSGVIFNQEGQVLLLRHRFWKKDSWGLPGGFIHRGETLEAALEREIREETNLSIKEIRLVRVNSGFRLRLEANFVAKLAGGALKLDEHEILEAGFFSPHNLPAGLLPSHRALIASLL